MRWSNVDGAQADTAYFTNSEIAARGQTWTVSQSERNRQPRPLINRAFGVEFAGFVGAADEVSLPGPGSSHDIPTYVGIDRERIVLGTISIRDSKAYMVTLTLQSVALFSDGFETGID